MRLSIIDIGLSHHWLAAAKSSLEKVSDGSRYYRNPNGSIDSNLQPENARLQQCSRLDANRSLALGTGRRPPKSRHFLAAFVQLSGTKMQDISLSISRYRHLAPFSRHCSKMQGRV
jgi:hypothetical protein